MVKDTAATTGTPSSDLSVFDFPYFRFLLLIWGIYVVIYLICVLFASNRRNIAINLVIGFGVISLGFVTGVIMGNNRNPISDSIMSSVFTLLGGVVVYMFAQKNTDNEQIGKSRIDLSTFINNENKLLVGLVLILFPVSLLYGSHIGAAFRLENDTYNNNVAYNKQLSLDSLEIWKKSKEAAIEKDNANQINYYQELYKAWSENERKRYEKQLSNLKKTDTVPDVPDYVGGK